MAGSLSKIGRTKVALVRAGCKPTSQLHNFREARKVLEAALYDIYLANVLNGTRTSIPSNPWGWWTPLDLYHETDPNAKQEEREYAAECYQTSVQARHEDETFIAVESIRPYFCPSVSESAIYGGVMLISWAAIEIDDWRGDHVVRSVFANRFRIKQFSTKH